MGAYRIGFFLLKHDEFLEKYNEIWKNVKKSPKKELDSELVHNEEYLKVKMKSYNGKINKHFHINKIPKEGSQCIYLTVIWLILFLEQVLIIILKGF